MGFYSDRILPTLVDRALGTGQCHKQRSRITKGLSGTVLEIGFGSGLNLQHYPAAVDKVLAVDPALHGRRLAEERMREAQVDVEFVGLDGQALQVDAHSVDAVLTTWTLCTIPDVARALAEVRRVLKPGSPLHFLEHGLAADDNIARWQKRLTPMQRLVAGGCELDRDIAGVVRAAGFDIDELETFYMPKTPKVMGYLYKGIAR